MSRGKAYIALLLVAHAILAVSVAVLGAGRINWLSRENFKGIVIGIFLGQVVSVAAWGALSNSGRFRRLAGSLLAVGMIYSLAVTSFHGWSNGGARIAMFVWLLVPGAAVALTATALRRVGIRCIRMEKLHSETQTEAIQFSLRQLALVVAICSALLVLVRGMKSEGTALTAASFILAGSVFAIVFVFEVLACLWAALAAAPWARRIWLPWLLAFAWWPLIAYAIGGDASHYMSIGILAVICVSLTLETLLTVRLAGFRLVRDAGAAGHSQ